jgi:hypothetical protein
MHRVAEVHIKQQHSETSNIRWLEITGKDEDGHEVTFILHGIGHIAPVIRLADQE